MTIQLASAIVERFGPCRAALDATDHPALAAELALMGCDTGGDRPEVGVLQWQWREPRPVVLARIAALGAVRSLVVVSRGLSRRLAEGVLFEAGWRRHPGDTGLGDALPEIACYRRGGGDGLFARHDAAALACSARWAAVAHHVRAGDAVLLAGEGATDGAAIVAALSRAGSVQAASDLADHPDGTFDCVALFDADVAWDAAIAEATRLLRRDGRLIAGWSAAGPHAPADWPALNGLLCEDYLVEARYAQPAGEAPCRVGLDDAAGDWLIAVASVNPIGGEEARADYRHPAFGHAHVPLVDFAAGYDNPWLYRVMVQMGERLVDDDLLARLAEYVAAEARPGSADQGAAIAVLGYRVLENRAMQVAPALLGLIQAYTAAAGETPHAIRWRVSLAFLAGRLAELTGDRAAAAGWYDRAAGDDWAAFSPILATKAVGAAFFAGRLKLADGDEAGACAAFRRGMETALAAAAADHRAQIGDPAAPLPFYLTELAEVIDMGSQCGNALAQIGLWRRDPGLYWRQVDVKRFGLASWALDMARENDRLRAALVEAWRHRSAA